MQCAHHGDLTCGSLLGKQAHTEGLAPLGQAAYFEQQLPGLETSQGFDDWPALSSTRSQDIWNV